MPWKKSSVIKILVGVSLVLLILMTLLSGDSISDIASSSLEENINRIERKIYSMDIKIDKGNYKANEDIKIHLGRYVSDKLEIYVVDSLKRKTVLNYKVEGTDVVIEAPKHLPSGKSTLQIKDGTKLIYSQNFEWGVLALNTTKSAYTVGETAEIQMAVLDDQGEMVCNANTTLYIYDPDNTKTTLSTNDKAIQVTDFCDKKVFTLEPDYKASYKFEKKGKYRLELTAETNNGTKTITEEIDIKESLDFEITRVTATRIYPVLEYPVTLNIKANRDFEGTIEEYIPDNFTLKDFDVVKPTITNTGIVQTLSYPVKLKKGETFSPKYSYDAPDDSPQFFTLGKISFKEGDKEIYKEDRMWQIAVDSAGASFPTRFYTTGFELNSVTAGVEWNTNTGTAPTISSSTIRTGGYALRTNPSGATSYIQYIFATADNATRTFLRAYFRTPSYPSSLTEIVSFVDNAGTIQASIQMTNTGTLRLFNNEDSAQIGSDTAAISVDTWYRVELETDFGTAATGNSIVAARLDGVEIASSTTVNFANGIARINIGAQATTSADFFFDDIGLNQDAYTNQNAWPGEGKVARINPDGNGTNVAWTNDYTAVNEVTPNDATNYILCSGNNQLEDYSLQSSTTAGIGVNDRVKLAEIWGRFSASAAGTQTHALSLLNAGGTGDTATAVTVQVVTWSTNDDTNPINADMVIYDEPGATNYSPLNSSLIDGMQARITSADCSPFVWVSTVWVYVEYVPAEGGRVYSSGFELQSITADMEWTTINGSPTIITGTKRSGEASMQVVTLGSGTREAVNFQFVSANANGPYFLRSYIYITTAPSAENTIIDFRNSSSTIIARITMDNSRQLQLRDEDGTIGSVSSALSTTTWYRIELKVDASGGASADTVEAKLDGTVFGTSSTRDLSTGVYQFGLGGNLNAEAQTTGDWLFDDVALNQNVGTTQNGYPGAGKIVHLQPNGDGTNVAWTGTSVNGANEYQNMDEVIPNDITDYNGSTTINILQDADFEPTSTYSISSTTDDITLVAPGVRFRTSAAATMGFSVSLLDTSTGPQVESSQIMTATTTWFTNNNTAPRVYPLTTYTAPAQSTAWTTSKIDSVQIRLREVTDTSSTIQVSTAWILVEYRPAVITISGTCDAFDETTDCGDTGTIKVAVNTTVASQEQTTVAGTWQIDEVPKPATGDVITVWIGSAADADEAVAVTQYDGTGNTITGIKLFKEHLTIGSDDLQNLTNTEIGTYDNSVSTNEDIFFDIDTGVLYVDDTSQSTTEKLTILSGSTYTPGGNLTTHDIDNQGDFVPGSNTITVQGSYSNQGTFTKGTSNINMTGTTTETLSGTMSGAGGQFYNLTFNGSGGAWSFGSNPPVEVANDLTITLGTLTSSSTTLTITGNYSNSGTFTHNSGTVKFNATDSGNTIAGTLSGSTGKFYNLTFDGSGGAWSFTSNPAVEVSNDLIIINGTVTSTSNTLTVTGNYSNSGTFTHNSGTTLFNATDAGNTLAGTLSGVNGKFYNLTFNGSGGAWSFTSNPAVEVANDFTITLGTVTSTSNALGLTISGNYSNSGTFTNNSGTIIFNATDSGNTIAGTLSGTSKFYDLTFNGVAGAWSFTSNPAVEVADDFTITNGTVTSTSNTLTITGNYSNSATFTHNSGTVLMNATDAGNTLSGTLSGASSFYNLTFSGSGGAWSFTSNPAVTVANDFTITNGAVTSTSNASGLTITGNYSNSGTFIHNSGLVKLNATDAGNTIAGTLSGATGKFYNLTFDGVAGAWSFTSNPAVEVANDLTITNGTLTSTSHASGLTVTGNYSNSGTFTNNSGTIIFNATDAGNTLAGTLSGASSFYNLTFSGAAGAWSFTSNPAVTIANALSISNGTLTATSGTTTIGGNFTKTGGTFTHNSGTVVFNDNTKISTLTYNADTTFSAFTVSTASKQMKFDNVDKTTIAGTFTVSGSACGTAVQLYSDSNGNQFDIDATGTVSVTYADIQDSNAITALSATNSVAGAGGNNTNWTITAGVCGGSMIISGICKAFDETTDCGDTGTILIAFGNSVQAQTQPTVSGTWSVTGLTNPAMNTIVTIYIDGAVADTDEAVAVTKYDGTGDITGVKLYKENLTIGSVDNQTLSNSELGTFDNSVSGDEDIFFDVTTNNLVVDSTTQSSTEKLTILSGNTHQPGGTVSTHDLTNLGTFLPEGNTITIAGSYLNSGTVTSSTSLFNMTGTTTETLAGNLSGTSKLYNLTFNGSGGAWSFTSNPTVEIYNDLTITLGTVTSTSGNLAVGGNYSNSGTFTHNSGTVVFNGNHTSNTLAGTLSGSSSFYNLKFDKCPVVSSPVSFWNFEEGTGGNAADNCTNAFTGTLGTGGTTPTWTTGKYGNGLSFDGNDYVNMGSHSALQLNYTDSFSFSSWVNTPSLPTSGNYPMVMNQTGPDSSYGAFQYTILFNGDDSGKLCVSVGRAMVGGNSVCVASPTSINTWYHVMGVYNGTDLIMYVDGTYVNTVTYSQGAASAPAGDLIIGGSNNNFYYTGKIDNPAVYNYVLTPAQVIEDMNRAGGGWSYTSNPNVDVLSNFTITNGIHTSTSGNLTITNNYSNLGTFTHNSGTVIMNATDAGNTLSGIMSGSPGKFYNLTFNGSGGAWSFTSNPAVEVANNLTITLGTVTSTSNTLTVTGNYSNSGTFTHNSGTTLFNATDSGNTIAGTLSGTSKFYNLTFNGSGGAWSFTSNPAVEVNNDLTITNGTVTATNNTLTITGNYSNAGTFTHNGGTVIMNATDAGNTLGGTMTTTSSFASLTFNGSGGAWSFGANSATVTGNFTITLGTVTAPSTTLTISGNYSNAGTFTHNSGSVVMDGIGITDPTLYWNYQENTGTAIGSRVGGGQSGTTTGTAWTSGVYDYALDYNGSDRTYASNRAISATDNFTLMAWVNVTSLPQSSLFMYNGSDTAGYGIGITNGWDGSGSELVALYGNVTWFGAGYTMPTNQWLHISLVRDSGTAKFYVNGVQTSGTNTDTPGSPADFFEVGNEPGQSRYFNGKVDEPKVYNYALTQAQVKSAMYTYYANTLGYTMSGNMTTTSSFNNLTFNGASGVWDFGANSATVANDLTITAGSVVAPSTTLTVTGNYSNSGTFTHNSGTVKFNATDSGNTIAGTLSGATGKFYNLTFDGVSGAWSFTSNPAVEVANNLTITNGTLTSTSHASGLTVTGNYSNAGTFTHNSGTVIFNATDAGNTLAGTLSTTSSFYNLTFNGSGGAWSFTSNPAVEVANDLTITNGTLTSTSHASGLTVTGNYSNSGTFTHNSGTMIFNATDAGNTLAGTLSGASSFYNLTFNGGGGAWSFTSNPAVEVANDFTITAGTVTSTSGNFTVTGNYSNSGTFTHNSGTMIFNATDAGNTLAGTLSGATGMFYNLTFNGSGGAWSFTSNPAVEVNNDLTITAGTLTSTSNASALIVTGNYSNSGIFTHNSGNVNFNSTATKTLAGNMSGTSAFYGLQFSGTGAWSFTSNPNVDVLDYFQISNVSANVTSTSATLKVSGNFRNSFNTTTFVHNNGTVKFDATDAGNTITSTSTLSFYNVIFDGVGGAWQLPTGSSTSVNNDLTITNGAVSPVGAGYSLNIYGNYLNNGTFTNSGGTVVFAATDTGNTIGGTLSGANGKFYNLSFSGAGGEWSFTGNPTVEVEKGLTLSNGTLTSTSGNLSIGSFFSKTGGTFTHNSGTITFVDSSANGSVRINTGTTFNNITVATPNKAILFDETDTVTVIGTFTINGSACGTPVLIKSWTNGNQADIDLQGTISVDYASIQDSNAITAATANNSVVGAGGNNTNWTINGGVCNTAPNSPTSLAQKTTGDVVIVTGGWNNTTSIKFTATGDDPNNPDTISLCVEYQQLGTGFTNTETGCGTGVAYSGTPVSVTVTLNSIPDAFEYHWQARLKDTAGAYSAWVSYDVNAESARDYGIDTTAPTLSTINDGTSCGSDVTFNDGSLSTISACWAQATATISGLEKYQYSVGTTSGATDVLTWTDLVDGSANVSKTINALTLQTSQQYYINVRAVDNATNTSGVISTNGQLVAPTISFSLNSSAVTFANLNGGNSYTDTKTSTLTTSTNAYNGYVVRAYKTQLLTNTANPSYTIPDFSAGSYAAPSEWSGTGYGYTSSDTSIQGSGKFPGSGACLGTGNAPCYAPFSSTAPGDIVADHTATVSGSPISSEQFTITYKVATPATQAGGQYTTTIIYTIVPQY